MSQMHDSCLELATITDITILINATTLIKEIKIKYTW